MGIIQNFNGASLRKPGVYSKLEVVQNGGLPPEETGVVGIIGEALGGAPGSVSGIVQYDSSTLGLLIQQFKSGPIVDAARALVNASNDARITNGASRILVWKTNPSTQSTLAVPSGWGTLTSQNYGLDENLISSTISEDTAETWNLQFGADWTATPTNLTLRVNGGTLVTLTGASCSSAANTVTEINSKLNTALGTSGINYASTATNRISINLAIAGTGAKRAGMGISLEFIATSEYTKIGVTVPQTGIILTAGVVGAVSLTATNPTRTIIVEKQSTGASESTASTTGEVGGKVYLEVGCNAATSCTLAINATQLILDATGGGASDLTLNLSDFATLNDLASFIDSQVGYAAAIPSNINGGLPPSVLDRVAATGVCATVTDLRPGQVKADAYEVNNWFTLNSALVTSTRTTFLGLPTVMTKTFLAGAVRGASTTSLFNDGFTAFEGVSINTIIPLVSQDASDDIVENAAYTDASSTYDLESIHTQAREHCKKMGKTENRSERDNYLGYRGTFQASKSQGLILNSELCSMTFLDVQVLDGSGSLVYKQPHILACMCAGMQAGGEVGEPITFKYIQASGLKHLKRQGATPSATELYNIGLIGHQNQAIDSGLLICEAPSSGGIRIVLGNTTYSKDANFVFNRKSVLNAAFYVARNLRNHLESVYIGEKARTATAEGVRNFTISEMAAFLRDEIIVGDDTNDQLGFKNLTVQLVGSAVLLDITITPVAGVDWILPTIRLDQIRQTA